MEEVIKNLNDHRFYKALTLPNNMKCLLISDKNIDISSLCLNISIGALEDPMEFQGLAHVLEHFLLTGSEKYPNLDDFSNFLLNNSGAINTGTDLDNATYCFECNSSVFEQGIERFVSYFISPKFDNAQLEKTIQIMCSEFEINKINDFYKNFQILRNISDKKSNFNKFGMGNKSSLKPGKSLLDNLINFFNSFYSSNLMTLIVYAKEDLNSLETLITQYFGLIPDKQINKPVYSLPPFNQNNMRKLLKVASNSEIDELNFIWVHNFEMDKNFSKPYNYIWYILNFGGSNSLFSFLKKLDYIYDLNVKFSNYFENFTLFELKLKLTTLGFQKGQEIANIIFEYIEFITHTGVKQSIFEEAQKLSILYFHYSQKKIDFPYMNTLAKKIGQIPNKYLLVDEYLWEKFDEKLIINTLKNFKLDNLFIFLNSKKIEKTDAYEPFYGTNYSSDQIKENFLEKSGTNYNFQMIPENPFLPINTKLISMGEVEFMKEYCKIPKKIYASEQSEIFYKVDNKFKTPKSIITVRVNIIESGIKKNEIFYLYCQIWKDLIVDHLSETAAQILRAHGKFSLNFEEFTILLKFEGFSDSMSLLVKRVVEEINNCNFETKKQKFEKILEGLNFENEKFFDSDPWVISDHFLRILLLKQGVFHKKNLLEFGKKISFQEFLEFSVKLLVKSKYEWLIYGNLDKNLALEMGKYFEENFLNKCKRDNSNSLVENISCAKLKDRTSNVFEYIIEKEAAKNLYYSCLTAYWQIGTDSPKNRVLSYIITFLISDHIYNNLSLNSKLGYSENGYDLLRGALGYKLKIISKNSCSQYLMQRAEETLEKLKEVVFNIEEKRFEDLKNIVLLGITSENADLEEEFDNDWAQLSRKEVDFKRDISERDVLKSIQRKDIEVFYLETFLNNPRKLEIHVGHKYFQDQNIFQHEQRLKEVKDKRIERISSINSFKNESDYFPSYY